MSVPLFSPRINIILDTFKTWHSKINEFIETLNKTVSLVNENFNFKEVINKIVKTNTTNIANQKKRIEDLTSQVDSSHETQNTTLDELTDLSEKNQTQETSEYNTLQQTETTNQNVVDIYITSFHTSLDGLNTRTNDFETNTQTLVDLANNDKSSFDIINAQLTEDVNEYTQKQQTNHIDLTNQYNDSVESAETVNNEYEQKFTWLGAKITPVQTDINQLSLKQDALESKITTLSDTVTTNETEIESKNSTLENAKGAVETIISQNTTNVTNLNSNLDTSIANTVSLKEQNASTASKISTLQTNLATPGYVNFSITDTGYIMMSIEE